MTTAARAQNADPSSALKMTKRERPEDGGILWHERLNAFECLGCGEFEEVRSRHLRTPEKLATIKELVIADHVECWLYDDAEMARKARRYRKAKAQRENQATAGLARQAVSWRGR